MSNSSEASSSSLSKQDPCQSASASKMAQGTLDIMVERENFLLAEIRWVLKVAQSRYSSVLLMILTNSFKLVSWTQN